MTLSLPIRIILAVVSGIGCFLTQVWIELVSLNGIVETISFYALPGLLFAAGVLFPYVSRSRFRLCRALGLIAASAASYWCAVTIAVMTMTLNGSAMSFSLSLYGVITASVIGALIVMGALVLLAPIRISAMYVVLGLLASISGGLIMFNTGIQMIAGYAAWHVLMCLAIYFGTPSTSAGERFSAILVRRIDAG